MNATVAELSSDGVDSAGEGERHLLAPGPTFERGGEAFDPAERGFTAVHNYALYFWRPYLGNTAFGLWELLVSFCYGDSDTAFPSLSRLSRMLTNSDHSRAVVTGRRGYRGALDRLQREGLVQVSRRGQGPTARYTFRMCKVLPLLRPEQVAHLSPGLRRDHAWWLERLGIDASAYQGAFPVRESPWSLDQGERSPPCGANGARRDASSPGDTPTPEGGEAPHPIRGDASRSKCLPSARRASAAPGNTPVHRGRAGAAPRSKGEAAHSANNTQEEDPLTIWWKETTDALKGQMDPAAWHNWLAGSRAVAFQDGELTVQAPSAWVREALERRLAMVVRRLLVAASEGRVRKVRFVFMEDKASRSTRDEASRSRRDHGGEGCGR